MTESPALTQNQCCDAVDAPPWPQQLCEAGTRSPSRTCGQGSWPKAPLRHPWGVTAAPLQRWGQFPQHLATTLPPTLKEDTLNQLMNRPGSYQNKPYKPKSKTHAAFCTTDVTVGNAQNNYNTYASGLKRNNKHKPNPKRTTHQPRLQASQVPSLCLHSFAPGQGWQCSKPPSPCVSEAKDQHWPRTIDTNM